MAASLLHERNIALLLEYDGTRYAGWQRQKNAVSVQEKLEHALTRVTGEPITVVGCSRTDAGVHAWGHVSNFTTASRIPVEKLPLAVQTALPRDIVVLGAATVPPDFNARFAAVGKRYIYQIWNHPRPSAIRGRFYLHEPRSLNCEAMRVAAAHLVGRHDFSSFMATGSTARTTVRTLSRVEVTATGPAVRIIVEGDGFLYNMVRIIAGTLLYVGLGKIAPVEIPAVVMSGERNRAGKTLPAKGLFLEAVQYDPPLFDFSE